MTSAYLIHLTAAVEPWLRAIAVSGTVVLVADRLLAGRPLPRPPRLDAPMAARDERWILGIVVGLAVLVRLVGWDSGVTPVFWFSQMSTLYVDRILHTGGLWARCRELLATTQVLGTHDSPILLPVHAGLQVLLGPRFGVPLLCGAIFGVAAVVLAWALGRRVRSQLFGLAFAALVACSPLMLTWSRLSALCTAGVTHVLLALLVGWEAGRRGSVLLALVTGLVMWTSAYQYYAARVAIPLALVAVLAGAQRAWLLRRGIVLALVATLAFAGAARLASGPRVARDLWPSYGGYAGNRGERTLAEFVARNVESFATEAHHTIERCFTNGRTGWRTPIEQPGMANGGLWTIPVAVLGLVGVMAVVADLRRQWIWLVLAVAGLALPVMSVMTARRALVLDLAWCALAAHGLFAAIDYLGARLDLAARRRVVAAIVAAIGAWSLTAVFALDAALPRGAAQHIPFGEAGFGDGIACPRCLDAAKGWSRDIANGAFVVLFDNDPFRENRTSPGGLIAYGKIAALGAGAPDRFVEGYSLMAGFDGEPPAPDRYFEAATGDFATYLATAFERTAPARIVWHFERPTSWEQWLAARLVAAGGELEAFETPLSPRLGIRVVTPAARRDEALAVLRDLVPTDDSPCITLEEKPRFALGSKVLLLAPDAPGLVRPPNWLATSYETHRVRGMDFTAPRPVGATVLPTAGGARVEIVSQWGQHQVYDLPSPRPHELPVLKSAPLGMGCAVFAAGAWWLLDPWTGHVQSSHPAARALPQGRWIGIASDRSGELVLASGDQTITIFDLVRQTEVARFPARVSPSVQEQPDECSPLAVGGAWIATVDLRTHVLAVYDRTGRPFGTRRLAAITRPIGSFSTIAGAGRFLGIAAGTVVHTFELRLDPACPTPPR